MNFFHVVPIKSDREGFDWKVWSPLRTMEHIAAERINDDPEYKDTLPQYFTTENDALFAARQLANRYAPAQVIHHMRPTKPTGSGWGTG